MLRHRSRQIWRPQSSLRELVCSVQLTDNRVEKISIKKVQAAKTKFVALLLFVSLRVSEEVVHHAFQKLCDKVLNAEKKDVR